MLSDSDLPIAEISTHFGYSSPSSFIRVFRQQFRITPHGSTTGEVRPSTGKKLWGAVA
jgi:AraC-like DNA-binding protein